MNKLEKVWYLKHINLFRDLTEADIRVLDRISYMKDYHRREQVYGQTDPGDVVYLLKEGRVKIYKLSPDGKELTLAILEPGEIFGEMALIDEGPRHTIAETLDDSLLCIIRRRDFELMLKKKPDLAMRVTKLIGIRRREIENQLENLVFRSAPSRLALLLMSLAEKHGVRDSRGIILNMKLSQQELANLIGTARETTSALLNEFKRLSIIDIQHRRIKILDQWQLKKIADAKMRDFPINLESESEV
ncbi:MAG: Crp/Fnr family transcriptional regulator [Candidatus Poribacteria bacterium]|nr:Crp/Fnr family transcriptional regulator [Candidatus Poribacteria bacterium]